MKNGEFSIKKAEEVRSLYWRWEPLNDLTETVERQGQAEEIVEYRKQTMRNAGTIP